MIALHIARRTSSLNLNQSYSVSPLVGPSPTVFAALVATVVGGKAEGRRGAASRELPPDGQIS